MQLIVISTLFVLGCSPWQDLVDYFRTVEACRVRPDWAEVRVRGHLPSLGPASTSGSSAFELTVLESTAVEISLLQKVSRGDVERQLMDLLVIILERGNSTAGQRAAKAKMRVVEASERHLRACVTCEAVLSAGSSYVILPVSLRPRAASASDARLDFVIRMGSVARLPSMHTRRILARRWVRWPRFPLTEA